MKRLGNLYDKIISMDNLRLADERARKGKTHSYGVRVHDKHAEADLLALHEALKAGTYKTSEYSIFTIYEPKERIIYRLPYFPEPHRTPRDNEHFGACMGVSIHGRHL